MMICQEGCDGKKAWSKKENEMSLEFERNDAMMVSADIIQKERRQNRIDKLKRI